jgi:hypothetical protein
MKKYLFTFVAYIFCFLLSQEALAARSCRVVAESALAAQTQNIRTYSENEIRETYSKVKSFQDKRNEEWSERQRCLCCHTTLPYMLTRTPDQRSKPTLDKFQEMAARKVENPDQAPWYPADHQGRNSNPTEAVVNALTLVMYDINSGSSLKPTTLKSIDRIFENQNPDGRLHWLDFALEPFESKKGELWGNSMAILTTEIAQKNSNYRAPEAQYAKLKSFVLRNETRLKINEKSVLLWAHSQNSNSGQGLLTSAQVKKFVNEIKAKQNQNGSWNQKDVLGQGEMREDTYSTAMALIGLIKAGQGKTPEAKKAVAYLVSQQITRNVLSMGQDYTLWLSTSMNRENATLNNRFASDVATSYASLALQMYRSDILLSE